MVYEFYINNPVKNNTSRMYVIDSLLGTLLSSISSNKTVIYLIFITTLLDSHIIIFS